MMTMDDKRWLLRLARLIVETLAKVITMNSETSSIVWFSTLHADFVEELEELERR